MEPADPSDLRWVGTEFVYFMDIPWVHDLQERLLGLPSSPPLCAPSTARAHVSMRGLTFGLLEDIMSAKIPTESLLVRGEMGELVISGDALARLVVPWARSQCDDPSQVALHSDIDANANANARADGERVQRTLVSVISALDDAVYATNGSLLDDGPDADLVCALATFLVSLSRCAHAIWGSPSPSPTTSSSSSSSPRSSRAIPAAGDGESGYQFLENQTRMYGEVAYILRGKLMDSWRTPSAYEAERLLVQGGGIPFAAYAAACPPTASALEMLEVDTAHYVPQHVARGCGCAFVRVPVNAVRECLERGEVPVVVLERGNLVVRGASEGPYVAISHVWADGLGSRTEDGLPRCQVERLARLACTLVPRGAFWQDGLCVPEEKALRRRAIGLMARTYANADKVLVIDSGIRTQCSLSTPKEECLLRIATSGWMQRIWTLQEGMLARELVFEVADGLVDCKHFDGNPCVTASRLIPILGYRRRDDALVFERRVGEPPRCTINDVITLLRYRTTSHPEDEPVAIAGLLGVDAGELVRVEGREERMKALLMEMRALPRHLAVFGWMCDRLEIHNFSWAPASLSEMLWPGDSDDPLVATCTEEGLFGDYAVVRFPEVVLGIDCGVIATITEGGREGGLVDGGQGRCSKIGCAAGIFNLVLSPYFFHKAHSRGRGALTLNGFLMKQRSLPESLHEEGVGVVRIPAMSGPQSSRSRRDAPLHCQFVAPGSARWGIPDAVETTRTRGHWHFVNATVESLRRVRVT